jgi:SAM-dependent methyltransferase
LRLEKLSRLSSYEIQDTNPEYLVYKSYHTDLFSCLKKYSKGRLLDIGCGNKPYEKLIKDLINEYIGCDIVQSSEMKVDLICDATDIKEPNESFDTILCTQTIEHVADHQMVVNEAYRLLKPGGYLILSGPMYWPLHEEPYDFFRFTRYGFRYILGKAGFKIIEEKANGGKWALCGQVIIQALYPDINTYSTFKWKALKRLIGIFGGIKAINKVFTKLDERFPDKTNTMNYVFVSQKQIIF